MIKSYPKGEPHARMTFAEFYIDYQPWITFIYLIIFASPIAVARFGQRGARLVRQPGRSNS